MKLEILKIREANGKQFNCSKDVFNQMREEATADREIFWTIHLNTKNKIIEKEIVAIGTLNTANISPREVVRKAVLNSTSQLICVHNHPSGDPEPSPSDNEICQAIMYVCGLLHIKMLDFIVIARDKFYSYADEGVMEFMEEEMGKWLSEFGKKTK